MPRYRTYYKPRSLRHREKKSTVRLIVNVILSLFLLYILITWGLPFLVSSLSFLNRFKSITHRSSNKEVALLAPPVLNIPYEATNSAQIRISGYSTPNLKVKIFIDDNLKTTTKVNDNGSFSTEPVSLVLGTNNITSKTVDDKGEESLPSKNIKVIYSSERPKLDLSSPSDNQQIKGGDKKVNVSGVTDPNDNLVVNGVTIVVGGDGHFSVDVPINDGDNNIVVAATNSVGNTTQVSRKVTYSP